MKNLKGNNFVTLVTLWISKNNCFKTQRKGGAKYFEKYR